MAQLQRGLIPFHIFFTKDVILFCILITDGFTRTYAQIFDDFNKFSPGLGLRDVFRVSGAGTYYSDRNRRNEAIADARRRRHDHDSRGRRYYARLDINKRFIFTAK